MGRKTVGQSQEEEEDRRFQPKVKIMRRHAVTLPKLLCIYRDIELTCLIVSWWFNHFVLLAGQAKLVLCGPGQCLEMVTESGLESLALQPSAAGLMSPPPAQGFL